MKIPLMSSFSSGEVARGGGEATIAGAKKIRVEFSRDFFGFFLGVEFGQDFVGECADFANEIFEQMQNLYTFT